MGIIWHFILFFIVVIFISLYLSNLIRFNLTDYSALNYELTDSKISGKGIHAKKEFAPGEDIGTVIDYWFGTVPNITASLGRWINHSYSPNADVVTDSNNNYILRANKDIYIGDEITADYSSPSLPWYISMPGIDYV